jgi:hypothetical protein
MGVVETSDRGPHARPRKGIPRECGAGGAQGSEAVRARQIQQAVGSQQGQAAGRERARCANRSLTATGQHGLRARFFRRRSARGIKTARHPAQLRSIIRYCTDHISPGGLDREHGSGVSILVHEMVHHIQHLAGLKYECPQEREKLAYLAQDRWRNLFGHSLAQDFDLDGFSLLVKTQCF